MPNHSAVATEMLLASMFKEKAPDRLIHSFMFNKPGLPLFGFGGGGTEIHYDSALLLQAALYLRKHGSPHLRSLSVETLQSIMKDFVSSHYYLLAGESFLRFFSQSYSAVLSVETKAKFAEAMAGSSMFVEPSEMTLFPLVPITVETGFKSTPFFFASPGDLEGYLGPIHIRGSLIPDSFPPFSDWEYRRYTPTSWLGVRAPTLDAARQMRAAILGAAALVPHHMERYIFSGRELFGGYVTIANGWTLSSGDPHTPKLMTNLALSAEDHPWLEVLADKITSPRKVDRRQLRALEYYYRAWAPDPVKRFPTLFAAIDAIFGDAGAATQAIVDAVGPVMGPEYTSERVRLMLGLRASVIHGGAPNVYESSKYEAYYETYLTDPTRDLELIVARCLQSVIFPGSMVERSHTHAALIKEKTGRIV
jgi:hypothetical protein